MKKIKPVILTSVIAAIIFSIVNFWVFEFDYSFIGYLILAGFFLVWIQKETSAYKFLTKLAVGSLLFGFLTLLFIFLRMYSLSHLVYDAPLPFKELWDKDFLMIGVVFTIVSFLGGLAGIVLKGFYFLYKNKLDKVIVFIGPFLVLVSSLAFYKIKISGTIMSSLRGWPYPFWIYQIKDVLDNFTIDKWIFLPGSLWHYVVLNYILYLVIFIFAYYAIRFVNQKLKVRKMNTTFILFGLLVIIVLIFASFLSIKESYISHQISWAGKCEQNSDCVIVANRSPFSCAIVVNKDNKDRILSLVNSFPSTGELQCSGNEKAVCMRGKCRISHDLTPNQTYWEIIKQAVKNCEVASIMQTHSLEVTAELKDGEIIKAKEPKIDDIFEIVSQYSDRCGEIRMATE